MKIQAPPGMRDFYPEDMRLQNWLFDHWRSVSRSFGFSEYEGPIFEYLDLYRLKSGEGIVSELFNFTDRGERHFAIRPEMTPTLARMVAARAGALPRPIKWFSIPRMCRAEKPQRGRLREFFQWNIDILGVEDTLADAEVVAVAAEFLRRVGLDAAHVVLRVNSRAIMAAALATLGVPDAARDGAFALIDRFDRLPPAEFDKQWEVLCGGSVGSAALRAFMGEASLERCLELARGAGTTGQEAAALFESFWLRLDELGVRAACEFAPGVVRGLAYYTGIVFEAHLRSASLRALLGGGRYDDLTGLLDGPRVPGVGFGMGDAPVIEALRELQRLPQPEEMLDVFVIDAAPERFDQALKIAGRLRQASLAVDFSYKRQPIGKQLKQATSRSARFAVIVGTELAERGELVVKDLVTGQQVGFAAEIFLGDAPGMLTRLRAAGTAPPPTGC
mgnify:CR=1 FL=1